MVFPSILYDNKKTSYQIFSKFYWIKQKSDCNYHFPIDLEQQTDAVRLLFQINRCMVNTIRYRFDLIKFRKDFSVCDDKNRISCPRLIGADPSCFVSLFPEKWISGPVLFLKKKHSSQQCAYAVSLYFQYLIIIWHSIWYHTYQLHQNLSIAQ